jgi:malate synthase
MEDAATAEISRTQVWQWVKHGARMKDGRRVTAELVKQTIAAQPGGATAKKLFEQMMTSPECAEFLTLVAYDYID